MNRKLLVTVFALALLGLTSFVVKSNSSAPRPASLDNALGDYWQRHPMASIPVTGTTADLRGSDYFQRHMAEIVAARADDSTDYAARHPELNAGQVRDTTDYFGRNPQARIVIAANIPAVDLTDYAARHPGLSVAVAQQVDTTDYYFRQQGLGQ